MPRDDYEPETSHTPGPMPQEESEYVALWLFQSEKRELQRRAKRDEMSLIQYIRKVLKEHIGNA